METISNDTASAWSRVYSMITAPAQQHATKPSVYTALLLSILSRQMTENNLQTSNYWATVGQSCQATDSDEFLKKLKSSLYKGIKGEPKKTAMKKESTYPVIRSEWAF